MSTALAIRTPPAMTPAEVKDLIRDEDDNLATETVGLHDVAHHQWDVGRMRP